MRTQGVQLTLTVTILTKTTVVGNTVQNLQMFADITTAFAKTAALVNIVIVALIVVA